jgi:4-carboxymuconolactone decarboxylase
VGLGEPGRLLPAATVSVLISDDRAAPPADQAHRAWGAAAGGARLGRLSYRLEMTRLRSQSRDDLEAPGRALWDDIVSSRGAGVVDEAGVLSGPFNVWVQAPGVGAPVAALGAAVRYGSSLEPRLLELAIITVAAHWRAEYEWWAHARLARNAGVPEAVVGAIGRGDRPGFEVDDERAVHRLAAELVETGRVGPGTYDQALGLLGDTGVIELVALCGYYSLVSFALNAFDVALPPGVEPIWAGGAGPAAD